jgi:hypothetical protein
MEKWTDRRIKRQVEEVIEESYLLGLSDLEIQQNLRNFVEICEIVLKDSVKEERDIKITEIRIAILKACLLLSLDTYPLKKHKDGAASPERSPHNILAEQVVSTKSLIRRLIEEYDPKLALAILEGNIEKGTRIRKRRIQKSRFITFLVQAGYFVLLALTGLLLWSVLFR